MASVTIHKGEGCGFINAAPPIKKITQTDTRKQTMFFNNPVHIIARTAVVGDKEAKGPLGKYFKHVKDDIKLGEKTF